MNNRKTLHVRTGDTVEVLTGRSRGRKGKVLQVKPKTGLVLVEGLNLMKKAIRPTESNPDGGIVEREALLHASNVKVVEKTTGKEAK